MVAKGLALAAAVRVARVRRTSSSGPAPAFQLRAAAARPIDLAQYRGQVVMINFWATWCGPCRQEMPLLEDIYKKYKPMGFTMLGVNVEPDAAGAEAWLQQAEAGELPDCIRHREQGQQAVQRRRHAEHRVRRPQGQRPQSCTRATSPAMRISISRRSARCSKNSQESRSCASAVCLDCSPSSRRRAAVRSSRGSSLTIARTSADPIMAFSRAPISQDFLDHVFESREGSRGATGGGGGGCGCN